MDKKISRLDNIAKLIDEDKERMGSSPSILDRVDHYAVYGLHRMVLASRRLGQAVINEVSEFTEFVQPSESKTTSSDK